MLLHKEAKGRENGNRNVRLTNWHIDLIYILNIIEREER